MTLHVSTSILFAFSSTEKVRHILYDILTSDLFCLLATEFNTLTKNLNQDKALSCIRYKAFKIV